MRLVQLSTRATNLGVLGLVLAGLTTGLGAFLTGNPGGRWVFWLHGAGGFALVLLLVWKQRVIMRSLRRRGIGVWAVPSLLLLALLLTSLASGVLWSTSGFLSIGGESGLTLHAAASLALAILLIPHARAGWAGIPRSGIAARRALLQGGLLVAAGAVLWRGSEALSAAANLNGARRRFTGSREESSFAGNAFPTNSWLLDNPNPIEPSDWRLTVGGAVRNPLQLTVAKIETTDTINTTIDCTGGWFSTQEWTGMPLARLLAQAEVSPGARSIVVRSSTGYSRRFSIRRSRSALLAGLVGGEPLAHEHGAPLRLVVPGARGYDWVKWVTSIEASTPPFWCNWPLPVS